MNPSHKLQYSMLGGANNQGVAFARRIKNLHTSVELHAGMFSDTSELASHLMTRLGFSLAQANEAIDANMAAIEAAWLDGVAGELEAEGVEVTLVARPARKAPPAPPAEFDYRRFDMRRRENRC